MKILNKTNLDQKDSNELWHALFDIVTVIKLPGSNEPYDLLDVDAFLEIIAADCKKNKEDELGGGFIQYEYFSDRG